MNSEEFRDEELRRIASELITEFRDALRSANAEAVTRGQKLMEDWMAERPSRHHSATETWGRLAPDATVIVQGDYGLLRTALGRRVSPEGPLVNYTLEFDLTEDGLRVTSPKLNNSVGLVLRWTTDDGQPRERVVAHTDHDAGHIIAYDSELAGRRLRVIAFDATSVTGFGVCSMPVFVDITLTGE